MIINSVLSKDFLLGNQRVKPSEFFSRFGFAIWDEAHEYATSGRAKAFAAANCMYMLGITAEANNREDKMDFIVHRGLGPMVVAESIPGFEVPDSDRYKSRVRIIKYNGHPLYVENLINETTGMMSSYKMSKQIIQDIPRLHLIIEEAKKLYDAGHNIFLWCDMRSVVVVLRDILNASGHFGLVDAPEDDNNTPVAHLMGGTTKEDIKHAQESRVIVATYQYAYRGVSLPKFDAMIFTTPRRAKIYQTLKRIFRMGGDTTITRQIIDIVDNSTKLKSQLSDRKKQYTSPIFGMEIVDEKISHNCIMVPDEAAKMYNDALDRHIVDDRIL